MTTIPLLNGDRSTAWQQHGLCRVVDADVFFPPPYFEHKPEREAREAKARAVCARCPVRAECLDWALATREPHGVWGGCSESERKRMLAADRQAS